ncbi:phage tail protein [Pseudonocardia sp.]|uniref:phage tail protein n=1 Tax=Pseudonocardia sp. TaxID=60912 RepID=UPI003D0B0885
MTSTGVPLGLSWATSAATATAGAWVPGLRPPEPLPTFNFAVEVDGLLVGGFSEVSGLESRIETTPYREGGVNGFTHALPTVAEPGALTLRRGVTSSTTLWDWHNDAVRGTVRRRNGSIVLLDRRQVPVLWWNFRNALPVRWVGPTFDARSDEIGVEAIELVHEGLTRPLPGQAAGAVHDLVRMVAR